VDRTPGRTGEWAGVGGTGAAVNRLRMGVMGRKMAPILFRSMKKTSFDRIAAAMLIGSLGYTAWFLAGLDWQRYRSFGITADLAWTPSSYVAFLLPPVLVLLILVVRRLMFGAASATQSGQVLFDRLRALALPAGSFAVFGSGPLAIRGLIDEVGDLDIIVREPAWSRVRDGGTSVMYGDHLTIDHGNGLTFGRSWAYGDFNVETLIDNAEMIDGLPFVRLEAVVEYKRIAGRPKDQRHIDVLRDAGLI